MPTADLRALAERLGMLKLCEVCCEGRVADCASPGELDACWSCGGSGHRLPTEAELRTAIFEAGWPVIVMRRVEVDFVSLEVCRPSEQRDADAIAGEAAPDKLALLALLRALEEVRRG